MKNKVNHSNTYSNLRGRDEGGEVRKMREGKEDGEGEGRGRKRKEGVGGRRREERERYHTMSTPASLYCLTLSSAYSNLHSSVPMHKQRC